MNLDFNNKNNCRTAPRQRVSLLTFALFSSLVLENICAKADGIAVQENDSPKYQNMEKRRGFYGKIRGGISTPRDKKNVDFRGRPVAGIGLGYDFNDLFRSDVELSCRDISASNASQSYDLKGGRNISMILNGYINLTDSKDGLIPYLSFGVGYGINKPKSFSVQTTNKEFIQRGKRKGSLVWNAGVGGLLQINQSTGIDVGYQYISLGDFKGNLSVVKSGTNGEPIGQTKLKQVHSHEFQLGFIIRF